MNPSARFARVPLLIAPLLLLLTLGGPVFGLPFAANLFAFYAWLYAALEVLALGVAGLCLLFALLMPAEFAKHFQVTPDKWRQRRVVRISSRVCALAVVGILASLGYVLLPAIYLAGVLAVLFLGRLLVLAPESTR